MGSIRLGGEQHSRSHVPHPSSLHVSDRNCYTVLSFHPACTRITTSSDNMGDVDVSDTIDLSRGTIPIEEKSGKTQPEKNNPKAMVAHARQLSHAV